MVDGLQNKKVAFIIQARMKSSRLPGKVLLPLPIDSDKTILELLTNKLNEVDFNADIIIATSTNIENNELEEFSIKHKIKCFRGSENDVLSRFISICENNNYDVVVRLTADNPIIDIKILQDVIQQHIKSKNDYTHTQGLPIGMNLEIINPKALISLKDHKLTPADKEHVTMFMRKSKSYKKGLINTFEKNEYQNIRTTVDYPSDYLVVSAIISIAEKNGLPLGLDLISFIIKNYDWLFNVNETNYQKRKYGSLKEEITNAIPILENLEFNRIVNELKR